MITIFDTLFTFSSSLFFSGGKRIIKVVDKRRSSARSFHWKGGNYPLLSLEDLSYWLLVYSQHSYKILDTTLLNGYDIPVDYVHYFVSCHLLKLKQTKDYYRPNLSSTFPPCFWLLRGFCLELYPNFLLPMFKKTLASVKQLFDYTIIFVNQQH